MTKRIICFATFLFCAALVADEETPPLTLNFFPAAVRLAGVGGAVGLGARVTHRTGITLLAGGGLGEANGFGAQLKGIPTGLDNLTFGLFAGKLTRAEFDTFYTRNLDSAEPFRQRVEGHVLGAAFDFSLPEKTLFLSVGFLTSLVKLADYFSKTTAQTIFTNRASLHDIETSSFTLSAAYQRLDNAAQPTEGFRLAVAGLTQLGRIAQSDQMILQYSASWHLPLAAHVSLASRLWGSDAVILKRSPYSDSASVSAALGTDCTQAGSAAATQDCSDLKNRLSDYIAASNRNGTALPVGGAYTLRGYSEMRYRAAHTRLLGTEVRWVFTQDIDVPFFGKKGPHLELAPFVDIALADDTWTRIYSHARANAGLGLRALLPEATLRLEFAAGQEGLAWFFTVGQAI